MVIIVLVIRAGHLFLDGRGGVLEAPDERAAGDLDDEVVAGMTVHALAHAAVTGFGDEARDVILLDEIVEVVVGLEDDAAAASAVATAGAALGDVSLAMERDTAFAAVAGLGVNFNFVDEHGR